MSAIDRAKALNEQRMNVWNQARELLDRVEKSGRGLNAEERAQYGRMEADLDRLEVERVRVLGSAEAKAEIEGVNEELRRVMTPDEVTHRSSRDDAVMRDFFRPKGTPGQVDTLNIDLAVAGRYAEARRQGISFTELRTYQSDAGNTGGSLTVPTEVATSVYAFMVAANSIRRIARVITTPAGNPISYPKVVTHSIGTQIASQTTAVTTGTAVLGNMTLSAYDFGQLSAVSNDMLEDASVDVVGFVSEQIGRSLGIATGAAYATGAGSGTPTGIITAAPTGANGTVFTGGTTIAQVNGNTGLVDPFIDLAYSVADSYRQNGNFAFLVHQNTAAALRKQREVGGTAGAYLWSPSPTAGLVAGQPDTFLGNPLYSDANIASIASNAKIAVAGDWSAFYVRDVGGLRLERSNDYGFNVNQSFFRGILRTDSNCIDSRALNILKMSVT